MGNVIIDRRKNPNGKNAPNRQKFVKRIKDQIKGDIHKNMGDRGITDINSGENIKVTRKSIKEPEFRNDGKTGDQDFILPGNKEFVPGDKIQKPSQGGGGSGSEGSDSGEAEDDFDFAISNDEYVDMLFEDLELPNMIKKENKIVESFERSRSGYSNEGNPSQLNLVQSMRNSIGRRMALKTPKKKRIEKLETELDAATDEATKDEIIEKLEHLRKRHSRIPFIDTTDLRFNNYTKTPKPRSQAVVFCIMDVSASMTEEHKDLAKRFFFLMNLFISRKYKRAETVFIRHHHEAIECNEEEFFHSRESGGTVVSKSFELMKEIMDKRYPSDQWNVYVAQATDGDNFDNDNEKLLNILTTNILPVVRYMSYIHVTDRKNNYYSNFNGTGKKLTKNMTELSETQENMIVKEIDDRSKVYKIFRQIFGDKNA